MWVNDKKNAKVDWLTYDNANRDVYFLKEISKHCFENLEY